MASLIPTQPIATSQQPVQNPHLLEMQDLENQYDAEKAKPNAQSKFLRLAELKKLIATKQTVMEEWTACNLRLNEKRDGINERLKKSNVDEDWDNCELIEAELNELPDSVEALLLVEGEAEKVKKEVEKKKAEIAAKRERAKTHCPKCDHKKCNTSGEFYVGLDQHDGRPHWFCQDDQTYKSGKKAFDEEHSHPYSLHYRTQGCCKCNKDGWY